MFFAANESELAPSFVLYGSAAMITYVVCMVVSAILMETSSRRIALKSAFITLLLAAGTWWYILSNNSDSAYPSSVCNWMMVLSVVTWAVYHISGWRFEKSL